VSRPSPQTRDMRFAAARRERREKNRKRPDFLGLLRIVLAFVLIGQSIRVAFTSPRLRLREVSVTGTQRLSSEQVQRLGGIPMGRNIFNCNLVQVSRQLRHDPIIKETFVTRELPGTIHVNIRERVPALQVMAGAHQFDADDQGFIFQPAEALTRGLPLLQLPESKLPPIGKQVPEHVVKAVWQCDRLAAEQGLRLRNLRVDDGGELWLNVESGPQEPAKARALAVRLGRETDLPEKFQDIRQALEGWPDLTAKAVYLNVMCAGRPAYMTDQEQSEPN
jgi:cell division septal protein FtsQ